MIQYLLHLSSYILLKHLICIITTGFNNLKPCCFSTVKLLFHGVNHSLFSRFPIQTEEGHTHNRRVILKIKLPSVIQSKLFFFARCSPPQKMVNFSHSIVNSSHREAKCSSCDFIVRKSQRSQILILPINSYSPLSYQTVLI